MELSEESTMIGFSSVPAESVLGLVDLVLREQVLGLFTAGTGGGNGTGGLMCRAGFLARGLLGELKLSVVLTTRW